MVEKVWRISRRVRKFSKFVGLIATYGTGKHINIRRSMKMAEKQEKWICAHCAYTAEGKFVGDICPE